MRPSLGVALGLGDGGPDAVQVLPQIRLQLLRRAVSLTPVHPFSAQPQLNMSALDGYFDLLLEHATAYNLGRGSGGMV